MKRRGFLGLMGGAAVAGPSMAKQAAATMADLSLPGMPRAELLGAVVQSGYGYDGAPGGNDRARNSLAKLLGRSAAQHAFHKKRLMITQLDPDIAGYRSFSMSAKIAMQRDRDYERDLEGERSRFEAILAGWFD